MTTTEIFKALLSAVINGVGVGIGAYVSQKHLINNLEKLRGKKKHGASLHRNRTTR
jgi:3-deoxy-D-arabino-heptulosonate 7-phosphate (DAHP) synthase class II